MRASPAVPTVDRSPPPGDQIAEHIRNQMRRGELLVGDWLPTTRAIRDEWNVSSHTVQRALRLLRDEGLIATRQSMPARVIALPTPPDPAPPRLGHQ